MAGNGRSGRPAKPHALHVLHGTVRADRARKGANGGSGEPQKPADLEEIGAEFWDSTVTQLIANGIAREVDSAQLATLCELWSLYRRSLAVANKNPTDKDARIAVVSYWSAFDRLASRFGLTPSDRLRLPALPTSEGASGKARFFNDPFLDLMAERQGVAKRNRNA